MLHSISHTYAVCLCLLFTHSFWDYQSNTFVQLKRIRTNVIIQNTTPVEHTHNQTHKWQILSLTFMTGNKPTKSYKTYISSLQIFISNKQSFV